MSNPGLQHEATAQATAATIVVLFIAVLLPPVYLNIGGVVFTPSRLFLLIAILPLLARLLSGQAGRLFPVDYLMMGYCGWIAVTYTYHYGTARIALSGVTIIEQLGAYLVGRVLIRNVTDYTLFIRTFFMALLVLFPFALFEFLTSRNLWAALFDPIFSVFVKLDWAKRMGLNRVMSGFEHAILFGLFCSLGVANFFYVYRPRWAKAISMMTIALAMTFMSISSAPLMAITSQAAMIIWDIVTKGRWVILGVLLASAYVTIDLLSNRTPVTILINSMTFNPMSAWNRIAIWDYGSATVLANPIMGIGLGDWPRPFWVGSSVDNFWLLIAMRHGFPAIILLLGALAFHLFAILKTKNLSPTIARYRTGYVLALLCLYFTLCTVHIWGAVSSFVFFYIGAGLWFVGAAGQKSGSEPDSLVSSEFTGRLDRLDAVAPRGPNPAPSMRNRLTALPHSRFSQIQRREDREE